MNAVWHLIAGNVVVIAFFAVVGFCSTLTLVAVLLWIAVSSLIDGARRVLRLTTASAPAEAATTPSPVPSAIAAYYAGFRREPSLADIQQVIAEAEELTGRNASDH